MKLWPRATAGLAAALAIAAVAAHAGEFVGKVVRVHDGDTLTILVDQSQVVIRLVEIDAPELGQAFGQRSRESLAQMCAGRLASVFEVGRDRHRRVLGRVSCAGQDANAEQLRRGLAWVFVRYVPRGSALYAIEVDARSARRGLWEDWAPVAPWEWRRQPRVSKSK